MTLNENPTSLSAKPRPQRKRFLIIHNPIAGMRRRWMLHEVCRHLCGGGADIALVQADSVEADMRLAREAVSEQKYDAVIAAGGDSTVRGVATGLIGSDLPLGIIPVGTGNVLAHEIGMRHGPSAVAQYLMTGTSLAITTGSANGELFSLMAGVGFDARVLGRLDIGLKRRMGKLAYMWPVLSEAAAAQPSFEVQIDGQPRHCTWLIVTKVNHYGGPFRIVREQDLQSDRFHAIIINARTRLDLARVMSAIGLGRAAKHPNVEIMPCRHILVPGGQNAATQIDGEAFNITPLEIRMHDQPLQLIVPPKFQARSQQKLDRQRQPMTALENV